MPEQVNTPSPVVSTPVPKAKPAPSRPSFKDLPKDPKERKKALDAIRETRLKARKDARDARMTVLRAKAKEAADAREKARQDKLKNQPVKVHTPTPKQALHKLSHEDLVKQVSTPEGIAKAIEALEK